MAVNQDNLEFKVKVDSDDAKKKLEGLNKTIDGVNQSSKDINISVSGFLKSLSKLSAITVVANQGLEILGKAGQTLGTVMNATSAKALQLESSIAKINAIMPKAERSQINLNKAILEMSKAFGSDIESTAKSFYSAVDNNAIGASKAIGFVTEAQKLAAITGEDLNNVTDGLGRVMLAYGLSAGQASAVSNALFIAMRDGSANFTDMIEATSLLSDMSGEAGISFKELTAILSSLTDTGLSTSKASKTLQQVISQLVSPSDELKLVINSLGYESAKSMIEVNGFSKSLELISGKVDGSVSSMGKLLGDDGLRGVSSVMRVVSGDATENFKRMVRSIESGSDDVSTAFSEMSGTGEKKIAKLSASFNASLVQIGQAINEIFLPPLAAIADSVAKLVERFANIDFSGLFANFKQLAIVIAGIAVTMNLTAVAMGWGTLAFSGLTASLWAATTASAAFIATWAPVGLAVTGIVVALDLLIANFNILLGKQKEFSGGFFGKLITETMKLFKDSSQGAKEAAEQSDKLTKSLEKVGTAAKDSFGGAGFDKIKQATDAINSLKDMTKNYADEISKAKLASFVDTDSEMARIESQKAYALSQVAAIEAQAKSAGLLTKTVSSDLNKVRGQIDQLSKIQLKNAGEKALAEGLKATEQSTEAVYKNLEESRKSQELFGKSVFERIGIEAAFRKKQIDDELRLYDIQTDRMAAETKGIEDQQKLLAARSEGRTAIAQKKEMVTGDEQNQLLEAGLSVGNSIVGAMSSGSEALASTMITQVGSMFGPVGEMAAGVINLFAKGPEFVKQMIDGFIDIVVNLPQMIIDGFFAFLDKIPEIAAALNEALMKVLSMLLSLSFWIKLLKAIWTAVIQGIMAMLNGVVGAIKGMFGKGVKNLGKDITKGFVNGTKAGIKFLTGYQQKVFGVVEDIFKGKKGKGSTLSGIAAALGVKGEEKSRNTWWVAVKKWWANLFVKFKNAFIKGTLKNLKMILPKAWYNKVEESIGKLKVKLEQFNSWWASAIRRGNDAWSFKGIASRYHAWLADFKKGWSEFSAWWKASIENAQSGWSLNGIKDRFTAWQTDWKSGWVDFTDWLKERFNAVFKPPVERGTVEGWIEARIPGFDIPWVKFAKGGEVPGRAKVKGDSLQNDTIPALLSAGEYILPRSVTQDKPLMKAIMQLLKSGGQTFSDGGWSKFKNKFSIKSIMTGAKQYGTDFSNFFKSESNWQPIMEPLIGPSYASTESFFSEIDLVEPLKSVWSFIKELGSGFSFTEFFTNPFGFLMSIIKDAIGGWIEPKVAGLFKTAFSGFNQGGFVPGYGSFDSVPSMLTPGEFVINKSAVQSIGRSRLEALNLGRGDMFGGGETTINVSLEINTEQPIDGDFIRSKIVPAIRKELKEASMRGEFLISGKGIR